MSRKMPGQDKELDAAEFVIGTLTKAERAAFEAFLQKDVKTREDVAFWERTFGALNASVSPKAPPDELWARIERTLANEDPSYAASSSGTSASGVALSTAKLQQGGNTFANDNTSNALRRSRGRWRMFAIAASVSAIALGSILYNPQLLSGVGQFQGIGPIAGNRTAKEYIAVVNANGDQPSLVININAETGDVTVRSVGVKRPDGKSLELWYIPDGKKAVSVGLVGEGGIDLKDITAADGDLLAITLEPSGGSPTGVATGPIIYTGNLIENVSE